MNIKTKLIAFYLPQYHPIKENNKWWGTGFTEWTNVVQAHPLFKGHHQPHIPADLGFYDLRLEETRAEQAKLATEYGISGFCYYHYWFNGKLLLDYPLSKMLKSGVPNFPFCLCWANENWTRAWDGLDKQVLIAQNYTNQDDENHIFWFINVFKDTRYIKIDGKPILLIYRIDNIPNVAEMINKWKITTKSAGFSGLYIIAVKNVFINNTDEEILKLGFDAIVDFQPNRVDFPSPSGLRDLAYYSARKFLPEKLYQHLKLSVSTYHKVNYDAMIDKIMGKTWSDQYQKFPTVFPSWDNTARRKTPTIIQNDNPLKYKQWLSHGIQQVKKYKENEQFVFINAWNEWAEGCHLEPDALNKRTYLEMTKKALEETQ